MWGKKIHAFHYIHTNDTLVYIDGGFHTKYYSVIKYSSFNVVNISIQLKWDTFNRVSYFLFFPGNTLLHIVALLFKTPNHWIWCLEKANIGMNW